MIKIDTLDDLQITSFHTTELKHYGVLGMKWGVRKRRIGASQTPTAPKKKPALDRTDVKKTPAGSSDKKIPLGNRRVTVENLNQAQKSKAGSKGLDLSDMTVSQLRNAAERMKLEKEILSLLDGPTKEYAMQTVVNGIKLEQEFKRLTAAPPTRKQIVLKKITGILASVAETQTKAILNAYAGKFTNQFLAKQGLSSGDQLKGLKNQVEKMKLEAKRDELLATKKAASSKKKP